MSNERAVNWGSTPVPLHCVRRRRHGIGRLARLHAGVHAEDVYEQLLEAGAPLGLAHAGYHAMGACRVEKGYKHWSHDIGDEDTPLDAGLGFTVAWDKPGGFVGRDALLAQKAAGLPRQLAEDPFAVELRREPSLRSSKDVVSTAAA